MGVKIPRNGDSVSLLLIVSLSNKLQIMNNNYFLDIDIDSVAFEDEIEVGILSNRFSFVLKWTRAKKLVLLDIAMKKGTKVYDILPLPIRSQTGTITVDLGPHQDESFKLSFRVYAVDKIPKLKAFLINDSQRSVVRKNPSANGKFKTVEKREIWHARL